MGGRGGHRGNGPGGAASAGDRGGLGRRHLHAGAFRRHRRDLPGLRRGWLAGPALCPAPRLVRAVSAPVRAEPLRFAARPRCRDIGPGTPLALGRRRQRFREVLAEPVSAERLPGGLVAGACLVGNLSRCHGTADDRRVGAAGLPRIRLALPADHGNGRDQPSVLELAARPGRRRRRTARLPGDHRIRAYELAFNAAAARCCAFRGVPGCQGMASGSGNRWRLAGLLLCRPGEQAGPARAGSALVRLPGHLERPGCSTSYQPRPAFMQVAEADGNRTRQRRSAALTGFEDRGDHQVPRRLRVDSTADIRPAQADPQLKATHVFVRLRRHFASSMSRYVGEVVMPRQLPR